MKCRGIFADQALKDALAATKGTIIEASNSLGERIVRLRRDEICIAILHGQIWRRCNGLVPMSKIPRTMNNEEPYVSKERIPKRATIGHSL